MTFHAPPPVEIASDVDIERAIAHATVAAICRDLDSVTAKAVRQFDPVAFLAAADAMNGNHHDEAKRALLNGQLLAAERVLAALIFWDNAHHLWP